MEVGWAGSAPHFIYTHHTSLAAPAHLLFLPFFVFSSAHGTGFVVVSPLDLLADTDDNEAGNETRTHASADMPLSAQRFVSRSSLLKYRCTWTTSCLRHFGVCWNRCQLSMPRMTIRHGHIHQNGVAAWTSQRNEALSAKPSSRG